MTDSSAIKSKKGLRQLLFLSVAAFFDGFDFMAITQILPGLRQDFGLNEFHGGLLISFVNAGALISYFLLRLTDRFGRIRLLKTTIAGYSVFTALSGLAPDIYSFAAFQFLARIFLISEVSIAIIYASEEFPASKRGLYLGIIQGFLSLGFIVCAVVVPIMLNSVFGWRGVYFIGIIPLMLIAYGRRSMQETNRYSSLSGIRENEPLFAIWRTPYRMRLLQTSLIWLFTYMCTHSAVVFWKEFAVAERNFTDEMVGSAISLASVVALPLVFLTGRFLDVAGRKLGAVIVFTIQITSVVLSYSLHGFWALTFSLILGTYGSSAVMIVLNALTAELFPTFMRGNAFAWSNQLIGRTGYVLSPMLVGYFALNFGWGDVSKNLGIFTFTALMMILVLFPETKLKELEQTSQL